ncbi:MAG: anthranilate phosphoribosyltransferase [bacterium]
MDYKTLLTKLMRRRDLTTEESAEAMDAVLAGQLSEVQIAAFLAAMATKGETVEELAGAARAMRRCAVRVQPVGQVVVDTCGTGGDNSGTFNVSTTTAFVVAGAGVAVAKHGNRSVSSRCGSADVLEQLGVKIDAVPEVMEQALQEIGIAFLFAPRYHGAVRHAMPVRKALGVRTIFNLLGPLANPAGATCQLLGVYAPELTEMFAHALRLLGTRRAFVVHGHDGMDELTICDATRVSELDNGVVKTYDLSPERYLGERADPANVAGGDAAANAAILLSVLQGEPGARRNLVLLNASAALVAAGRAPDITAGLDLAAKAIDSGAAAGKLQALVKASKGE